MINRTFERLKFRRTYVGGSKKSEFLEFERIGNVPKKKRNDFEYRDIIKRIYDDKLNVLESWRLLSELTFVLLGVISIFVFYFQKTLSIEIFILSFVLFILNILIKKRLQLNVFKYSFALSVLKQSILNKYGIIVSDDIDSNM